MWRWILGKFSYEDYVKNVKVANKMGFTYLPELYSANEYALREK